MISGILENIVMLEIERRGYRVCVGEFAPLLAIKDHYPKYVVTMDDFWNDNVEGVRHKDIAEFLLMKEY
ncbi:MAG: hypothetical protein RO469_00220 [Thermincola sp.]|jgi:hypothetical protein|nr:hypothetical protein [Thermincola sp.]MDT3701864.1 hypothetical protein [Thermincola sp.]